MSSARWLETKIRESRAFAGMSARPTLPLGQFAQDMTLPRRQGLQAHYEALGPVLQTHPFHPLS